MIGRFVLTTVLASLVVSSAGAGTLSGGAWTPGSCGDEPAAPTLNVSSAEAYGESLKWIKLYETKIKVYNDCFIKEANADNQAINDTVKAEQARVNAAFDKYNADSKTAQARFSGKSK